MPDGSHQPWSDSPEEVARRLQTNLEAGLSESTAEERLRSCGPNQLQDDRGFEWWRVFLRQFADFMIGLLAVAAVISAVIGEWPDAVLIGVIVLANAVIGFLQEWRAEKAVEALKALSQPVANVRRDGQLRELPAADLVPGDLVEFAAGGFIPADVRLNRSAELEIDEAPMTGESLPVEKQTSAIDAESLLPDRTCMAFSGTAVMKGRGRGIVTATGMQSELGRIAAMLSEAKSELTPLQKRLAELSKRLAYLVVGVCLAIFAAGVLRAGVAHWDGRLFNDMLLVAVSLAVAAIPEGLPAVITVTLALGSQRMARRNAIIRRLPAVETLGSVDVICTDKTGTLTQNRMAVSESLPYEETEAARQRLLTAAVLCNDAQFDADGTPAGAPTETALIRTALDQSLDVSELRAAHQRLDEIAFSSDRKRMATLHRWNDGFLVFVKGAAEQVLDLCEFIGDESRKQPLTADGQTAWKSRASELAAKGRRVLAVAQRTWNSSKLHSEADTADSSLCLLGLMAIVDPVRPEARESISRCRSAGIRPVMITGDHAGTANAIADDAALRSEGDVTITGQQIESQGDAEFDSAIERASVFARVAPEHKLRIVRAYQANGHVVAMTGDGVNDGPALKQADIGVAMGITGTDVAKASADMILADDDFSTIVAAIEEGRVVYDNISKFVRYLLTANTGEVLLVAAAILVGLPIPLLPVHLLWINLVTDGLPALALGFEPGEKTVMQRPPRRQTASLFGRSMITSIVGMGLLMGLACLAVFAFYHSVPVDSLPAPPDGVIADGDFRESYARTMTFLVLALFQLFYVLAIRSSTSLFVELGPFSNWRLTGAFLIGTVLQFVVIYVPWFRDYFHTVPLSVDDFLVAMGVASSAFFVIEAGKLIKRVRQMQS